MVEKATERIKVTRITGLLTQLDLRSFDSTNLGGKSRLWRWRY